MYFNQKNNTNIDTDFKTKNNFIKKYKFPIIISVVLLIMILIILYINLNKTTKTLVLNGNDTITIYVNSEYIEPGFKAYNSNNQDLSNEVSINSNLNIKKAGTYEITYMLDNVTKIRKINVISKPKEYTYIYLKPIDNNIDIYLNINEEYKEPGYQVISSNAEDLTDKVTVSGKVNTSKKGIYKLTYTIVDNKGITISKSRLVTVMDTEINLSLNNSEYTNQDVEIKVNISDDLFDYMILPDNTKTNNKQYLYKVTTNGKYTFKTYNKKGHEKEESIQVSNIDKEKPTGTCSGSYGSGKSTIIVNSKDNIGIKKYIVNNQTFTNNNITINKEFVNVTINIYDKADNETKISCQLKQIPSSPPSSSNNNKITNNLLIGDSRTVGMCESYKLCKEDEFIAKVSSGYSWFENTAIPNIENKIINKNYNIIILMGVNDVGGTEERGKSSATKYYNKISNLATTKWKNQNIIFVSVNPVIDGYSYAYTTGVNSFNKEIKSKITSSKISNLKYCDTNSKLNITTSNAKDGLHYNKTVYEQIYNIITKDCI